MLVRNEKGQFKSKPIQQMSRQEAVVHLQSLKSYIDRRFDDLFADKQEEQREFICLALKYLCYSYERNELEWD